MNTYYNPMENKFLVYSTQNGGLGDRLFGLVSSYLLALLNDYNFRIKLDDDITYADVFTSPIDWWNDDWKLLPLKRGRFNIESDLINNLDFFKTQTISEKFPDSDCVYIYSNQNFIQYIFENEKYKNKLKELELTPENCFSKLINNLLVFEDEFQKNYDYLKSKLKSNNVKTIGIHIRTNRFWGDVPEISDNTLELFNKTIDAVSDGDERIFLCSDDEQVIFDLKNRYGDDRVFAVPGQAVHYSKNTKKTIYDVIKTFFEIWLLSECDTIITSYWSNFSRVAVLKSMKQPVIVEMEISDNPKQPTIDWVNSKNIKTNDDLRKHFNIPHPIDNGFRYAKMLALSTKI